MIRLNRAGAEHLRELIEHGKVDDGPYAFDDSDRDALLGPKGTHVRMLAQVHLGEDDSMAEGEARRYKYPCARGGMASSRGLMACRDAARDQGHDEVRSEAESMLGMIAGGMSPVNAGGRSAPPGESEVRFLKGLEFRAAPEGSDSPGTIVGMAAVYNRLSDDLGGFRELIRPGAFRDVMKSDIRAWRTTRRCTCSAGPRAARCGSATRRTGWPTRSTSPIPTSAATRPSRSAAATWTASRSPSG